MRQLVTTDRSGVAVSECAPSILLSHPTGNQNVRNSARSLQDHGMLAEFWTTVAWDLDSPINSVLPSGVKAQLERRAYPLTPKDKIHCVPLRESIRLAFSNTLFGSALCAGERPFSVVGMYRQFDSKVAQRLSRIHVDAVYAYEGGALQTFREAKKRGITTIYELPTGYWHWATDVFREEGQRNPDFASLIPKLRDSDAHIRWKDEELSLADVVVVPSEHVRRTLKGTVQDSKIRVVPYGAPELHQRSESVGLGDRLRVLFVGNLSQGKGISYLLEAVNNLSGRVEFTIVGRRFALHPAVDEACKRWRYLGSIPHAQVLQQMLNADVLVLPSLSEGFGLVVTEALACGLPVIVTPNVGAADLVQDGVNGFVVPVASASEIANRLERLCSDRKMLKAMSHRAYETAAANEWGTYRENWASMVRVATCRS